MLRGEKVFKDDKNLVAAGPGATSIASRRRAGTPDLCHGVSGGERARGLPSTPRRVTHAVTGLRAGQRRLLPLLPLWHLIAVIIRDAN